MKRLVYILLIVGACALSLAATKSRYVFYDNIYVAASANRQWAPALYDTVFFVPLEMDIMTTGTSAGICTVTIYLCDTLTTAGPVTAQDSFFVLVAALSGRFEYAGPMSDTMRVATSANSMASLHAFK